MHLFKNMHFSQLHFYHVVLRFFCKHSEPFGNGAYKYLLYCIVLYCKPVFTFEGELASENQKNGRNFAKFSDKILLNIANGHDVNGLGMKKFMYDNQILHFHQHHLTLTKSQFTLDLK